MSMKLRELKIVLPLYVIITGLVLFMYIATVVAYAVINKEPLRGGAILQNVINRLVLSTVAFACLTYYRRYAGVFKRTVIVLLMFVAGTSTHYLGNYYTHYSAQKAITDRYLSVIEIDSQEFPMVKNMKNTFTTYPILAPIMYFQTGAVIVSHLAQPESELPNAYRTDFIRSRIDVEAIAKLPTSAERTAALKNSLWYKDAGTLVTTLDTVSKLQKSTSILVLLVLVAYTCKFSDFMYSKDKTSFIDICKTMSNGKAHQKRG